MKIISLITLAILFLLIGIVLIKTSFKKEEKEAHSLFRLSVLIVGLGIVFNTVNENIIKSYDLISNYFIQNDFIRVFSFGKQEIGYSQELIKLIILNLGIAILWFYINFLVAKLIGSKAFRENPNKLLITMIIFLSLVLSLNPLLKSILEASYQIINQPFYN